MVVVTCSHSESNFLLLLCAAGSLISKAIGNSCDGRRSVCRWERQVSSAIANVVILSVAGTWNALLLASRSACASGRATRSSLEILRRP